VLLIWFATFQVNEQVISRALTQRTLVTGGERVTSPMNLEQANDVKDAFIKVVTFRLIALALQ